MEERAKKLYSLLEDLRQAQLGQDWYTQKRLIQIENKVKDEIRNLCYDGAHD